MKKILLLVAAALTFTAAASAQAGSLGIWAGSVHSSGATMTPSGSMGIWAN